MGHFKPFFDNRDGMYWDAIDLAMDVDSDIAAAISLDIIDGWYSGLVWC